MKHDKIIDRNQLIALCSLILLSPALRLYPGLSARLAGRGAWLSAPAALPAALLYLLLLCRLMAARQPGEGLGELCLRALGGAAGRILLGLFSLWLILYCGFVLRAGADRFVVGIFPQARPAVFSVSLGLACGIAALGSFRSLVRMARMLLPLLLGTLLLLLLISLRSLDKINLLPLTAEDGLPILAGTLPVLNALALGLYLPCFFAGDVAETPRPWLRWARWLLGMSLLLAALCAAILGSFGPELTGRLSVPFFTLVRNLVFLRSFERMDALVVSLWLFPDFLLGSALLFAAGRCLGLLLGRPDSRRLPPLCGVLALLPALLLGQDGTGLALWSERIIPAINLAMALAAVPLIYIVGKIRKTL